MNAKKWRSADVILVRAANGYKNTTQKLSFQSFVAFIQTLVSSLGFIIYLFAEFAV